MNTFSTLECESVELLVVNVKLQIFDAVLIKWNGTKNPDD